MRKREIPPILWFIPPKPTTVRTCRFKSGAWNPTACLSIPECTSSVRSGAAGTGTGTPTWHVAVPSGRLTGYPITTHFLELLMCRGVSKVRYLEDIFSDCKTVFHSSCMSVVGWPRVGGDVRKVQFKEFRWMKNTGVPCHLVASRGHVLPFSPLRICWFGGENLSYI